MRSCFLTIFVIVTTCYAVEIQPKYALLIGCNDGGEQVGTLRYAERDVQRFSDVLVNLGQFDRGHVITLLRPDAAKIEHSLRSIRQRLKNERNQDNTMFLVYYSGHADGTDLLLGKRTYSLSKLQSTLDSFPAAVRIGIFDACQSGVVTAFKGGKRAEPFYFQNTQKIKGQVIIASSSATERAQESESLKGSIFTFHWLNALRGSADFSGDHRVTLNEAYQYAYRKTVETTALVSGEVQHPMYRFAISGQGEIVLTDLSNPTTGLLLDASCEGKFLVLSDNYTDVYADFAKKREGEMFISLAPGSYTIINAKGQWVGTHTFIINNRTYRLAQTMLVTNALTESRIKGPQEVAAASAGLQATTPLSTWSMGLAAGALLRPSRNDIRENRGVSLSFVNTMFVNEQLNLFLNFHYALFGINAGAEIGFEHTFRNGSITPFFGAGVGIWYVDHKSEKLQDKLGPSVTTHIGLATDIGKRSRFFMKLPYTAVFAGKFDQSIGLQAGLLFSGRFRDVQVIK